MTTPAKDGNCTICEKIGLRPFTKENIFYYYIPLNGLLNYGALCVNVMNPALVAKMLPGKKDATNVLLLSSVAGGAFYVYGRPHLRHVPAFQRGLYAIMAAGLWGMGSVLGWAVLKSLIPKDNGLATMAGLVAGVGIVKVTLDYFNETDKLVAAKK
uniref:Hypothetical conserved protein n=1 Tax=Glossina morsitans morsitans TaxID=37546 RepID=D3TPX5_GLOMM